VDLESIETISLKKEMLYGRPYRILAFTSLLGSSRSTANN